LKKLFLIKHGENNLKTRSIVTVLMPMKWWEQS